MSRMIITLIAAVALSVGFQASAIAQHHDHTGGGHDNPGGQMGGHMSGVHSEEMMEQMHTTMDHMSEMMQEMHGAHEQMEGLAGDHHGEHASMMQDMTHDLEGMLPLMDSMLLRMRNYMDHDGDMSDGADAEWMHEMMADMDRMFSAGEGMMQALRQMHGGFVEQGGDHAGHQH
ncbi:hypothetical protein H8E07_06525 [bacterium]|nr:hypothetical protein [bacterium]